MCAAAARLNRVNRGLSEVRTLREQLKARKGTLRHLEARSWLVDVLDAPSAAAAVALVNERIADVRRETDVGSEIPRVSARIALTAGTALAIFALLDRAGPGVAVWAAATFALGLLGALLAAQIGRISRQRTREQIETWNLLVKVLVAEARAAQSHNTEISEHQ